MGLLEGRNTPCFKWVCTICPNPMIILKKCSMFFIDMGGPESPCIMHTFRMTNRIVDNEEVMRHDDCLELN